MLGLIHGLTIRVSLVSLLLIEVVRSEPLDAPLAPASVQVWTEANRWLILGANRPEAILIDALTGDAVRTIPLPAPTTGAVVTGHTAYLTTREPAGRILKLDLNTGVLLDTIRLGHTPMAPTLSQDGLTLFVASRFENCVVALELKSGSQSRIPVVREPVGLALGLDEQLLFVANHLPEVGPFLDDENPFISTEVSVINTGQGRLIKNIRLPNGSHSLRGIVRSPDGDWVVVTHILSNYTRPAWTLTGGSMNRNVVSLINARTLELTQTIPLDDPEHGAANPWAVGFSNDGKWLFVTHAGTQELSVLDFPSLLERAATRDPAQGLFCAEDLILLQGLRRRIQLPVVGPRALAVSGTTVAIVGYFCNGLALLDLAQPSPTVRRVELGSETAVSPARQGEEYFNDASRCFQQWQSCATCHPDGRKDALYWDLLNDGLGNTKNTKSLLMSALTPPVMWSGVRADAHEAIQAGIHHIQFAEAPDEMANTIGAYLLEMKSVPSPFLNNDRLEPAQTESSSCAKCHYPGVPRGTLTAAALRGKELFQGRAGCVCCHPHPLFTSQRSVDAGLGSPVPYDIPSLIEVWRTAPYLHNSEGLTLRETITGFNHRQLRGNTSGLTETELDDLIAYLRSL